MRGLPHPRPAASLVWFDQVDSTNEVAARVVASWPPENEGRLPDTMIVAGCQSSGRGRGDHVWQSPPGGLFATWLAWLVTPWLVRLPMAAGATLAEAVSELAPDAVVGLKWPNDVMVGGRKLGGILCQSRAREEWSWVAVGFGINVEVVPTLDGDERNGATCLRQMGVSGGMGEVGSALIASFLGRIRANLEDEEGVRAAWEARSIHCAGEPLRVRSRGEVLEGRFAGFGRDGHLDLEVDGRIVPIAAGELVAELPPIGGRDDATGP